MTYTEDIYWSKEGAAVSAKPTHVGEPNIVIILYDNKEKVGVAEGRGHTPIGCGRVGKADTCRGTEYCNNPL